MQGKEQEHVAAVWRRRILHFGGSELLDQLMKQLFGFIFFWGGGRSIHWTACGHKNE